jgi:Arc-like DNA binding dprotein
VPRKPADLVKLNLRFAEALRLRLEKHAERNNRSLNSEIVRRLEESFRKDDIISAIDSASDKTSKAIIDAFKGGEVYSTEKDR